MTRSDLLAGAFVSLADSLVAGYHAKDVMDRLVCDAVNVFDGTAAGVMLIDRSEELRVIASSDTGMDEIGILQLRTGEGPCLDSFRDRAPVQAITANALDRWPLFAPIALREGHHAVSAFPMRLREQVIGVFSVFRADPQPLWDTATAQALADVATVGLVHHWAMRECHRLTEDLRLELHSYVSTGEPLGPAR